MADLSKLSDAELEAIANGDFSALSDETLAIIAAGPEAEQVEPPKKVTLGEVIERTGIPLGPSMPNITPDMAKRALGTGADIALEGGGAAAGQAIGATPFLSVPTFGLSVPAGGAIGGALGNALAQTRQIMSGEREDYSMGQLGGAAVSGLIPGASLAGASGRKVATEGGKQVIANLGAVLAENTIEGRDTTALQAGSAIAGAALGTKMARSADAGNVISDRMRKQIENAERRKTLQAAQAAGYKVLPSATEETGKINAAIEYIAGKAQTVDELQKQNALVTNALVRRAIGMDPNEVINLDTLGAIRKKAGEVYADVEKVSPRAKSALVKFKEARDNANSFFRENDRQGTAESLRKAREWDNKAKQYQKVIDKELKGTDLYERFQRARETIAKVHVIEDAFEVGPGIVRADIISKRRKQGRYPTTDELKIIDRFAEAFPRSAKNTPESGASIVAHPLMIGSAGAAVGGVTRSPEAAAAAMTGMLFAPTLAKQLLVSDIYQKMATAPRYESMLEQDAIARFLQYSGSAYGREATRPDYKKPAKKSG